MVIVSELLQCVIRLHGRRNEGALAVQKRSEIGACVRGCLEMLVSARGKEVRIEEKNGITEHSRIGFDGGLVERLQERVPQVWGKGFNLEGVRRVFVRGVGRGRPLQVL